MRKKDQLKTLWNENKRGLIILGAVVVATCTAYMVIAANEYQKARAETEAANSEF